MRLAHQGELDVGNVRWKTFEESWLKFWETRGKEKLEKGGKVVVGGQWCDAFYENPTSHAYVVRAMLD